MKEKHRSIGLFLFTLCIIVILPLLKYSLTVDRNISTQNMKATFSKTTRKPSVQEIMLNQSKLSIIAKMESLNREVENLYNISTDKQWAVNQIRLKRPRKNV